MFDDYDEGCRHEDSCKKFVDSCDSNTTGKFAFAPIFQKPSKEEASSNANANSNIKESASAKRIKLSSNTTRKFAFAPIFQKPSKEEVSSDANANSNIKKSEYSGDEMDRKMAATDSSVVVIENLDEIEDSPSDNDDDSIDGLEEFEKASKENKDFAKKKFNDSDFEKYKESEDISNPLPIGSIKEFADDGTLS